MALLGAKNGIFGPQRPPWRPPCDEFNTKTLPIWCPVMMVTKKLEYVPIIWLQGQKTLYFWPKNQFFLRYAHTTHFLGLKQTRLNGIISSPYPQVTLDTFGFPVDVRSAVQQAVFWPRLPKNGPFWAGNAIFSTLCPYGHSVEKGQKSGLYGHITHFFGLRQTRLNGIISSPYPQVTLDAFGFLVCAPSAAW